MTFQHPLPTFLLRALCGLLLISIVACCRVSRFAPPPPPPICNTTQQNGIQTTASASTIVNNFLFTATLTRSLTLSSSGQATVSATHLVVQRSNRCKPSQPPVTALTVDTQSTPNGAVQLSATFGTGFQGVKQVTLVSTDRATFQGTVNGAALAPFPIKADPKSIKLADGSAVPATIVDVGTQQALPTLFQMIQGQCTKTAGSTPSAGLIQTGGGNAGVDPPAHPFSPSTACLICVAGVTVTYDGCVYGAAIAAGACGLLYPLCFAVAEGACLFAEIVGLGTLCHIPGPAAVVGVTPGPPCCPTFCGGASCCNATETCASPGLCCSAGLSVCGSNCCTTGQTCLGGNNCCPTASVCGSSCCGSGQTCLSNGTCCDSGNVCNGQSCCNTGDTCMPNGSCCSAGHKVCNGVCCPNSTDICDPNSGACTSPCPGGVPPCGGSCCSAGQLCCQVSTTGGTIQPQCINPLGPFQGNPQNPWCGSGTTDPNGTLCNNCSLVLCNCASNQQCGSICQRGPGGTLCSSEWYCH